MKFLGNGVVFVSIYIVFMLPTYFLPYLGSNSAVFNAAGAAVEAGVNPLTYLHLASLAVLILITWFRGSLVGKQWIVTLPILAAVFDMAPGINLIPLIPTVLHIFVLVKGISESPAAATVTSD